MLIVFWDLLCNLVLTQSSERPGSTKEVDDEDNATRPVGQTEVTPSQPQQSWQPQANKATERREQHQSIEKNKTILRWHISFITLIATKKYNFTT
jgi:hypothetical protein